MFLMYFVFFHQDSNSNFYCKTKIKLLTRKFSINKLQIALQLSEGGGNSGIGIILGWLMGAIYLGGRLPQIFLNVRFPSAITFTPIVIYSYFTIDDSFFLDANKERLQRYYLEWPTIKYFNFHSLNIFKKKIPLLVDSVF